MNARAVGSWVVCLWLLPFSCRDFDGQQGGGTAGQGALNAGGEDGGRHGGAAGSNASDAEGGAPLSPGRGGAADNAGATLNDDLAGQSGTGARPDGSEFGGAASAGDGGEGGVPSLTTLSPSDAHGVVLWLSASSQTCVRDDEQRLSVWLDASGKGNDAKPDPSLAPPKFVNDTLDGHDVVRFTPLDLSNSSYLPERLQIADNESLHLAAGDFTVLVVGRFGNSEQSVAYEDPVSHQQSTIYNGAGAFLAKQNTSYPFRGILMMANYPGPFSWAPAQTRLAVQLELGGALALSYSDHLNHGGLRLYEIRRRGDDLSLFINGEREGGTRVATGIDLSAVGYPMVLGGEPVQPLSGDIAEVVLVSGAVSDAEQHGLEGYLMTSYGLR